MERRAPLERLRNVHGIASDVDGTLRQSGSLDLPSSQVTQAYRDWRTIREKSTSFHDFVVTGSAG